MTALASVQQTMLDLTADELSVHAGAGEIVEVAQEQLRTGAFVSLRKEGAGPLVHLGAGVFVMRRRRSHAAVFSVSR